MKKFNHKGAWIDGYFGKRTKKLAAIAIKSFPSAELIMICFNNPRVKPCYEGPFGEKGADYPDFPLAKAWEFIKKTKRNGFHLCKNGSMTNIYIHVSSISIYLTPFKKYRAKHAIVADDRFYGRKVIILKDLEDGFSAGTKGVFSHHEVTKEKVYLILDGHSIKANLDDFKFI